MVNILDHLTEKVETQKEYKYQTVIDYLKRQGYNTGKEHVTDECLTPEDALKVIQDLLNKKEKRKCLTKDELISYFQEKNKPISNWEQPFRTKR